MNNRISLKVSADETIWYQTIVKQNRKQSGVGKIVHEVYWISFLGIKISVLIHVDVIHCILNTNEFFDLTKKNYWSFLTAVSICTCMATCWRRSHTIMY